MVPFIWSFDAEDAVPGLGLNRFAELFDDGVDNRGTVFVDYVKRIGREIKGGVHELPNMAWDETEASASRPASNVRGEIMSVTPRGPGQCLGLRGGIAAQESARAPAAAEPRRRTPVQIVAGAHLRSR
jgi:hypothetical protein